MGLGKLQEAIVTSAKEGLRDGAVDVRSSSRFNTAWILRYSRSFAAPQIFFSAATTHIPPNLLMKDKTSTRAVGVCARVLGGGCSERQEIAKLPFLLVEGIQVPFRIPQYIF